MATIVAMLRRRLEPFPSCLAVAALLIVAADRTTAQERAQSAAAAAAVPAPGELNPLVIEVLRRYPTDGTHRYWWPRGGEAAKWRGCTKDLEYGGEVIAAGDAQGRCYCCGLTFEVLLDAWRLWCERAERPFRIDRMMAADVRRLQTQWFGSAKDRTCVRTALVENALGFEVEDWHDARPGDFVQLWRTNGSGHSVVFLEWVREAEEIVGIRYWSTQKATAGIGEREERFARQGHAGVRADELWLCRVGRPRDGEWPQSPVAGRWQRKGADVLELRSDLTFELRSSAAGDAAGEVLCGRWHRRGADVIVAVAMKKSGAAVEPIQMRWHWRGDTLRRGKGGHALVRERPGRGR